MRLFFALLVALLLPASAHAADGDFFSPGSFGGVSVYILCDATPIGSPDCADFDMRAKFTSTIIDRISFALLAETGTGCIFTPKGRIVAGGTRVDILGTTTLTTAVKAEASAESWWRFVGGTVSGGTCTTATVYLKVFRGN